MKRRSFLQLLGLAPAAAVAASAAKVAEAVPVPVPVPPVPPLEFDRRAGEVLSLGKNFASDRPETIEVTDAPVIGDGALDIVTTGSVNMAIGSQALPMLVDAPEASMIRLRIGDSVREWPNDD